MPGVYLEYIKAGKFVVPVELTFQTETIKAPSYQGDIRGLVNTSKWIERHNWKEIKAMLKPAVEACLKYNETPLENIPKSHHISYGREVSLGYLIVANKISTPFISVLDTKKNCWTDDEDDEDELLGITDTIPMEDHGGEFTEFIPTKTAIRVCVVKKSVVSIDDARRIRKELGVRSDDVRHYFPSATHMTNEAGPSSLAHSQFPENNESAEREGEPTAEKSSTRNDQSSSDSEVENIPRTFGDPDEIRDAARIYTHVLNRDVDSGEDPDDDLSLPDIEPHPPKKKKGTRSRKKSASLSPSKSKRLTHNNILAISHEGQANFSEEDNSYKRKKSKRKRTVAVVEPMRTLPNGQMSFEHAIGALGSEKRRKARPGSSHGGDKAHFGGGRSKQPPAIDIIAPDDDRLTITNPPEPIPTPSTSTSSPGKEGDREMECERKKLKKRRKRRRGNIDDDPHKWERLTPSPLFDNDEEDHGQSSDSDTEPEMPVLMKMVDSDEEKKSQDEQIQLEPEYLPKDATLRENEDKFEEETPKLCKELPEQASPDITQIKANAAIRKKKEQQYSYKRKIKFPNVEEEPKTSDTESIASNKSSKQKGKSRHESAAPRSRSTTPRENSRLPLRSDSNINERFSKSPENTNNIKSSDSQISLHSQESSPSFRDDKMKAGEMLKPRPTESPKPAQKSTRKKKMKRRMSRKNTGSNAEKAHEGKPEMGDAQTQTDDLQIVEVKKSFSPCVIDNIVKLSRSCEASSEEDFDVGSQSSRVPGNMLDLHSSQLSNTSHHLAINLNSSSCSPSRNDPDDDGLFSFESPTLPVLSLSQTVLVNYEDSDEKSLSPESVHQENNTAETEASPTDTADTHESPGSPQPGCSHWITPFNRPISSPPPMLSSVLMPPPTARPPRTPRKLFNGGDDEPPRLSVCGMSDSDFIHETEESEDEPMPAGAEAVDVTESEIGRTFHVLNQPEVFKTGLKLIQKVTSKQLTVDEVTRRFMQDGAGDNREESKALVPVSVGQKKKRDLSPDICELVPDKRLRIVVAAAARRSRRSSFEELSRSRRRSGGDGDQSSSKAIVLRRSTSEDEISDIEGLANVEVMDYLRRQQGTSASNAYEPQGDEFDLSQRSYCMQNVVPEYGKKSRVYKIHSKAVQETTRRQLIDHFNAIRSDIFGIFQGTIPSSRHRTFVGSYDPKKDLPNWAIALPFTTEQCEIVNTLICDHLVPDKSMRCDYMEYINYVLFPEAVIRIFSRINNIPYNMAEIEMSYSACYEGEVPEGYYSGSR